MNDKQQEIDELAITLVAGGVDVEAAWVLAEQEIEDADSDAAITDDNRSAMWMVAAFAIGIILTSIVAMLS